MLNPPAFEVAQTLLEQSESFFLGSEPALMGAELDFGGPGPTVEGAENLGLHVARGFDHLVEARVNLGKACVNVSAQVCEVLLGVSAQICQVLLSGVVVV